MSFLNISPKTCLGYRLPYGFFDKGDEYEPSEARIINSDWAVALLYPRDQDNDRHLGVYFANRKDKYAFRVAKHGHTLFHPNVGILLGTLDPLPKVLASGGDLKRYVLPSREMPIVNTNAIIRERTFLHDLGMTIYATKADPNKEAVMDVIRNYTIASFM